MIRLFRLGVLALAVAGTAFQASASGSAGPGGASPGVRGDYSVGKSLLFRTMVCRTCPIKPPQFDRTSAQSLKVRLETTLDQLAATALDDDPIDALCTASERDSAECAERLRVVLAYLDRRFRLR